MSTLYTDTAQFIDQIQIPSDGDDRDAQSFNVGFEALADRTRYLKNNSALNTTANPSGNNDPFQFNDGIILNGFDGITLDPARDYNRPFDGACTWDPDTWRIQSGIGNVMVAQNTTISFKLCWSLRAPAYSTIIYVSFWFVSGGSHTVSGFPSTRPALRLVRKNLFTGVETLIGTYVDTSATTADYDTGHQIFGLPNYTVQPGEAIYALIRNEADSNAISGGQYHMPAATFQRAILGEE